jgi:ParB family chromosome partitioning protein
LTKLHLTAYEDLFETAESRQDAKERMETLPLELLHPFPDHPFKVRDDEKMAETVESIRQYGVLVPILTRPRPEGGYEIVSGHRRVHASKRAGLENISAIIRDLDDDEATIVMVDSNLQREQLLPSEKAFAYKMKLEALHRQAGRPPKENGGQVGHHLYGVKSREIVAENAEESARTIQRYIRLTYLIPTLLDKVDANTFAFSAAVEISYLPESQQHLLEEAMDYAQVSPSIAQARKIRAFSASGKLDSNVLESILSEEKPLERKITLRDDKLKKYFPADYTPLQMEKIITGLLEEWRRRQERDTHAR